MGKPRKTKAVRRLQFDEDKSSPVSGTIIRDIRDVAKKVEFDKEEDCKYEETALGIQVNILLIIISSYYLLLLYQTSLINKTIFFVGYPTWRH